MTITALFDRPYFTGTAVSTAEVPSLYPVALNGRGFLLDTKPTQFPGAELHRHQSIPLLRPQQDSSTELGERSVNPEGLWRRSQTTWHHGAGQSHLDLDGSDRARFRSSKGINPWTRWQISLLPTTGLIAATASSNTNLGLVTAGGYLYLTSGSSILFAQSITGTWTGLTGVPAQTAVSVASDGYNVYTAHTSSGIYKTTRGASSTASYATGNATLVGYVRGRLMAAYQNNIYNVTASGALPAALLTQANTDFTWVGFAEGLGAIFMAGYSGDKSLIYSTAVKSDGTALDVPHVAGELPDGEIVRSIQGYLGYILLGTDKGVRFCAVDTNGNLQIGALISVTSGVYCFEPQDRFVWFGWSNYDSTSTGLGRMDLTAFIDTLTPAYASDLMASTQGTVISVATFAGLTVFAVSGVGVYAQSADLVSSGTIDSGAITYDLPDKKVALFLDVKHGIMPAGSTHSAYVAGDDLMFTAVGTHVATSGDDPFPIPSIRAEALEIREVISRGTDTTQAPVLYRHTLRSEVTASTGAYINAPLLLHEHLELLNESQEYRDVNDDLAFVAQLRDSRQVVNYQEGTVSYSVIVDDYDWRPHHLNSDASGWNGSCVVKLKVVT